MTSQSAIQSIDAESIFGDGTREVTQERVNFTGVGTYVFPANTTAYSVFTRKQSGGSSGLLFTDSEGVQSKMEKNSLFEYNAKELGGDVLKLGAKIDSTSSSNDVYIVLSRLV